MGDWIFYASLRQIKARLDLVLASVGWSELSGDCCGRERRVGLLLVPSVRQGWGAGTSFFAVLRVFRGVQRVSTVVFFPSFFSRSQEEQSANEAARARCPEGAQ
jgi:hypothetical protein